MEYTYDDKLKVLRSFVTLSPSESGGLASILYSRVLDLFSKDEFLTEFPQAGMDYFFQDACLEILVNELDVFYGRAGGFDSFCGVDKGVGAFEINAFYPTMPEGAEQAARELCSWVGSTFSEEEFINNFTVGCKAEQSEQDKLILQEGGIFDALLWYNKAFDFENDYIPDDDKLNIAAFWLNGACLDEYTIENYGGCDALQYGFSVRNKAIDRWLNFIPRNLADEEDVEKGSRVLNELVSNLVTELSVYCNSLGVVSFNIGDTAFKSGNTQGRTFEAHCFITRDAIDLGYCEMEYLIAGCMPPVIMVSMLKTQRFLQCMDEKYHFLKGVDYGE